jgi:hypothetical protein
LFWNARVVAVLAAASAEPSGSVKIRMENQEEKE